MWKTCFTPQPGITAPPGASGRKSLKRFETDSNWKRSISSTWRNSSHFRSSWYWSTAPFGTLIACVRLDVQRESPLYTAQLMLHKSVTQITTQQAWIGKPNGLGILELITDWPEGWNFGASPEEMTHAEEALLYNKSPENEKQYALFMDKSCQIVGKHWRWKAAVKGGKAHTTSHRNWRTRCIESVCRSKQQCKYSSDQPRAGFGAW